jgi:hypothetical protein
MSRPLCIPLLSHICYMSHLFHTRD